MFFLSGCMLMLLTDYGWQKTTDGGVEYIVQIEPELVDSLRRGEEIVSVIPPNLGKVTRLRIRVGSGPVPKDDALLIQGRAETPAAESPDSAAPADSAPPVAAFSPPSAPPAAAAEAPTFEPPPLISPPNHSGADAGASGSRFEAPRKNSKDRPKPIPRTPASSHDAGDTTSGLPLPFRSDDAAEPVRPAAAAEPIASPTPEPKHDGEPPPKTASAKGSAPASSPTRPAKDTSAPAPGGSLSDSSEAKPWGVLVFTSLLLFASIGLNVYLGWIARGALARYRDMARQMAQATLGTA